MKQNTENENIYDFYKQINKGGYAYLSKEEKLAVLNKVDNFLEALYVSPHMFNQEVFHILKKREEKLASWRHNGQVIGGAGFLFGYGVFKLRNIFSSYSGFYFRNFCYVVFSTILSGYLGGRVSEYVGNKLYYRQILMKLAMDYNISDNEIEEMHLKINEKILNENKEIQTKQSSLDSVKFKL
jgi:hypothetical protein